MREEIGKLAEELESLARALRSCAFKGAGIRIRLGRFVMSFIAGRYAHDQESDPGDPGGGRIEDSMPNEP